MRIPRHTRLLAVVYIASLAWNGHAATGSYTYDAQHRLPVAIRVVPAASRCMEYSIPLQP